MDNIWRVIFITAAIVGFLSGWAGAVSYGTSPAYGFGYGIGAALFFGIVIGTAFGLTKGLKTNMAWGFVLASGIWFGIPLFLGFLLPIVLKFTK